MQENTEERPAEGLGPTVPRHPKAPEWDDYWAHHVAEKAKKLVLGYFGLATVLVSLSLTIYGIKGIKDLLETHLTKVVDRKEREALRAIELRLSKFDAELEARRAHVRSRSEEFENLVVLRAQALKNAQVPPGALSVIDLSADIGPIRDTGAQATTVGFAIAYAMQVAIKLQSGRQVLLSPRGIFQLAKKYDEMPGEDYEGTWLLGGLIAVKEVGAYLERDWPYDASQPVFQAKPSYRLLSFEEIHGIGEITETLRQRRPVIVTMNVTDDFARVGKDGRLIIRSDHSQGGKAVCMVGYDARLADFKFVNDWGSGWGLNGFGLIRDTDLRKILVDAFRLEVRN